MKQSLCAGSAPCRAHRRAGHMAARTSRAAGSLWRSVGTLSLQLLQQSTMISPTHDLHVLLSHTKHRKVRQPDSLRNHSLSCPQFEPRFHAELASILPHLVFGKCLLPLSSDRKDGGVPAYGVSCWRWGEGRGPGHCSQRDCFLAPSLR